MNFSLREFPLSAIANLFEFRCQSKQLLLLSYKICPCFLNEICKLHVRPLLGYGDVVSHIPAKVCEFSGRITLPNLMEKFESVQYSAARAVTGTWRGTSREKLNTELGWESLSSRRWSRRLTFLYKIINNLTPTYAYMKDPILQPPQTRYSLRNRDVVGGTRVRTEKFKSSFYPHCLSEWNKIDPEIRLAPSVAVFKAKLLSIIRPPAKSVFGSYDPIGLSYLSQIRVGLSKLNFHKFKHNFRDTVNLMRQMNDSIENTEHFLPGGTSCCSAQRLAFTCSIKGKSKPDDLIPSSHYLKFLVFIKKEKT